MTIKFSDITGGGIPYGDNAGRPANPGIGKLYSNGEEKRLELYTSTGWQNIVSETPGVVSISGNYAESVGSATFEITGTNFSTGAIASVIGTDGIEVNANSTTVNSIVSITAVFSGLSNAYEPYDVKITNTSNLFGLLPDSLYINATPVWQTASGSLGTFGEQVSMSVSALATDDSTITYALASGSALPSGVTLNSSTGLISGILPDITTNTTYTFTINASDGSNSIVPRTFSFISNAAPVWVTSSGSLGSFASSTTISTPPLSTTDTDTVTYALANGSSLPLGLSINSSTGIISGTLPTVTQNTTYTFTINALDGVNATPRVFSISSIYDTTVELLMAGGGGGTGYDVGGGGGGGGLIDTTKTIVRGTTSLISIGSGGTSNQGATPYYGLDGGNTSAFSLTAIGGGGGGYYASSKNGRDGGSGGGAGMESVGGTALQSGSASGGYGFNGGSAGGAYGSGGGGGAGGAGANGVPNTQVAGGLPRYSSITGSSIGYSGGGYGNSDGGGLLPTGQNLSGSTLGYYGFGANGTGNPNSSPYNGNPGVVIIAYPDTAPAIVNIPGTLTYDQPTRAGYRVYRFTAGSGTITF